LPGACSLPTICDVVCERLAERKLGPDDVAELCLELTAWGAKVPQIGTAQVALAAWCHEFGSLMLEQVEASAVIKAEGEICTAQQHFREVESRLVAEIGALQVEEQAMRSESSLQAAAWRDECQASKLEEQELVVEVTELRTAQEGMESQSCASASALRHLEHECAASRASSRQMTTEVVELQTALEGVNTKSSAASAAVNMLEQEYVASRSKLTSEVIELRASKEVLENESRAAAAALSSSGRELEASKAEEKQLQTRLDATRDRAESAEHSLESSECAMKELQAKVVTRRLLEAEARCGALEEREQQLTACWKLELAGSIAAADAWRERCDAQSASFRGEEAALHRAAHDAQQDAAKVCDSLRNAHEDIGRWRQRVQELHAEHLQMEGVLETLMCARNGWRAKSEAAERQLQGALLMVQNRAQSFVEHEQEHAAFAVSQAYEEIAEVRSSASEWQAHFHSEAHCMQQRLLHTEQLRDEYQTHMRGYMEELQAVQTLSLEEKAEGHEALEKSRAEAMALLVELSSVRAGLRQTTAGSEILEGRGQELQQECRVLQAQLLGQAEQATKANNNLQQVQSRFNAAEFSVEFLHTELAQTRTHSEEVCAALAVEQSESSVLRCRVRELTARLEENLAVPLGCSPRDAEEERISSKELSVLSKPGGFKEPELEMLRKEMRDNKGGEPLSDITGSMQCLHALEAQKAAAQAALQSADLERPTCSPTKSSPTMLLCHSPPEQRQQADADEEVPPAYFRRARRTSESSSPSWLAALRERPSWLEESAAGSETLGSDESGSPNFGMQSLMRSLDCSAGSFELGIIDMPLSTVATDDGGCALVADARPCLSPSVGAQVRGLRL